MLIKQQLIYRQDLQQNLDKLYLFGDNEERRGLGGQASQMRGEPNAVGVRTKRRPRLKPGDFWTDETFEANCRMIEEDLVPVRQHLAAGGTVVVPTAGLGTGLAQLAERAPKTYAFLQATLNSLA
jgi:hypothetical protein